MSFSQKSPSKTICAPPAAWVGVGVGEAVFVGVGLGVWVDVGLWVGAGDDVWVAVLVTVAVGAMNGVAAAEHEANPITVSRSII